jgi:alkane 1-monooxygenase
MKGYTGELPNGEAIHYVDRKRWLWLLSVLYPLQTLIPVWLHHVSGNESWFVLLFVANFVALPLLDSVIGQDENNPPEEVVMQLNRDRYYRYLTYATVCAHFVALLGPAVYAGTQGLSWWAFLLLAVQTGFVGGLAINTAHELGHKNSRLEKWLARVALGIAAYGHFTGEHNRGHHMLVSTPDDTASARMGEPIYRFAIREIPGAFMRGWEVERERLRARGLPLWHHSNPILQSYAVSLAVAVLLVAWAGWLALPFLLIHHATAYWQLTSANYIEHYGLLRERQAGGRYERCQPHHSWNSNHILTNLVLFHLQRHSDHHKNPLRRYQSLRHYDDLPSLPNGYLGMFLLAWVPPLWFRIMDKRLMALAHIDGDLDKVNMDPRAAPALFREWERNRV